MTHDIMTLTLTLTLVNLESWSQESGVMLSTSPSDFEKNAPNSISAGAYSASPGPLAGF